MVTTMFTFIKNCWNWIPIEIYGLFTTFILIAFGDSVLGLVDRAWRVFGR